MSLSEGVSQSMPGRAVAEICAVDGLEVGACWFSFGFAFIMCGRHLVVGCDVMVSGGERRVVRRKHFQLELQMAAVKASVSFMRAVVVC